jgi:YggT family protein
MRSRSLCLLLQVVWVAGLRVGPAPGPLQKPRLPTPAPNAPTPCGQPAALVTGIALLSLVEPASASDISWIAPTKAVLGPLLTLSTLAFLFRVVLSWFPNYNLKEPPWSFVAIPTEPFLKPTRMLIPPVAGVDISPLVWVAFLSFISEILLGPQGLFTIMQRNGGM